MLLGAVRLCCEAQHPSGRQCCPGGCHCRGPLHRLGALQPLRLGAASVPAGSKCSCRSDAQLHFGWLSSSASATLPAASATPNRWRPRGNAVSTAVRRRVKHVRRVWPGLSCFGSGLGTTHTRVRQTAAASASATRALCARVWWPSAREQVVGGVPSGGERSSGSVTRTRNRNAHTTRPPSTSAIKVCRSLALIGHAGCRLMDGCWRVQRMLSVSWPWRGNDSGCRSKLARLVFTCCRCQLQATNHPPH